MSFALPDFLFPPEVLKRREEQARRVAEKRCESAVPWSPTMKWQRELNLKAETYEPYSLFKVKTSNTFNVNKAKKEELVLSPGGRFCYTEKRLRRAEVLPTMYGREEGSVVFDGPVVIPALHDRDDDDWNVMPWMSLTPMEILSLRPGTQRAKGCVIVAGLGLGHQLIEVSKRKQVKELVLVEKDQELVDWLLPVIKPRLGRSLDKVVVGDAYEVLPTMRADVALLDIFRTYGGNSWERDRLKKRCSGIGFMWAWGAASGR
jgi:hypothetical protein